uniref:Uncharacterized protein n=1 Tax=Nelumbo nucifera TaxID=4432 RepID=A0A822YUB8_NELNU|nr:TPA_asm: hypothetical protein HUJ06_005335 [Nelumbo nucifera]
MIIYKTAPTNSIQAKHMQRRKRHTNHVIFNTQERERLRELMVFSANTHTHRIQIQHNHVFFKAKPKYYEWLCI